MPTYAPSDAFSKITPQLGNIALDSTAKGTLADDAQRYLWNVTPWRWERKALSAFSLTDNTQEYTAAVPSDFMGLLQAELLITSQTPNPVYQMDIKKFVDRDTMQKVSLPQVRDIAFLQELNSGAGGFRIVNPSVPSGTTAQIRGVYRALPSVKYTSANLSTTFAELPDQYFYVYQEVLLWWIYKYVGDPRAGGATITSSGKIVYSGQMANAMAMVEMMLNAEDTSDTEIIYPHEQLGPVGGYHHNLYP